MKYLLATILCFVCSVAYGAPRYYVRVAPSPGVVNIIIVPQRQRYRRVPTLSKPPYNPVYDMTLRAPAATVPCGRRAAPPWQSTYWGEPLMIYNPYYEED